MAFLALADLAFLAGAWLIDLAKLGPWAMVTWLAAVAIGASFLAVR